VKTLRRCVQKPASLAQFTTCFYQPALCSNSQNFELDLQGGRSYVVLVRGSHDQSGVFQLSLDCQGTSGGLPSWLQTGAHSSSTISE
jgi:hypothetical protein